MQADEERPAARLDTDAVRRHWPEVLDAVKGIRRVTWSFVSVNTKVLDYDGQRLLLEIATPGQAETFRRGNHAEVVRQALIEAIGLDTRVESAVGREQGAEPDPRRAGRGPRARPQEQEQEQEQASPEPEWGRAGSGGAPDWATGAGVSPRPAKPPTAAATPTPTAATPSADDEDLETSASVGQPVIESVLGGTVIAIDDEPAP